MAIQDSVLETTTECDTCQEPNGTSTKQEERNPFINFKREKQNFRDVSGMTQMVEGKSQKTPTNGIQWLASQPPTTLCQTSDKRIKSWSQPFLRTGDLDRSFLSRGQLKDPEGEKRENSHPLPNTTTQNEAKKQSCHPPPLPPKPIVFFFKGQHVVTARKPLREEPIQCEPSNIIVEHSPQSFREKLQILEEKLGGSMASKQHRDEELEKPYKVNILEDSLGSGYSINDNSKAFSYPTDCEIEYNAKFPDFEHRSKKEKPVRLPTTFALLTQDKRNGSDVSNLSTLDVTEKCPETFHGYVLQSKLCMECTPDTLHCGEMVNQDNDSFEKYECDIYSNITNRSK